MDIHEYQGKEILASYGVKVQRGYVANNPQEAVAAAKQLTAETGTGWHVIKAQVHAGGRGKGGGVKLAKNLQQVEELAEQIIGKVENVRAIVNELAVMGSASLVQRSSDTLTTGKVKASLVDAKDLYASAFKVVTERGTVYLMGRVTQREADRATEITRTVGGVQKVIRILEILSEDELRRLLPSQGQPAAAPAVPATK